MDYGRSSGSCPNCGAPLGPSRPPNPALPAKQRASRGQVLALVFVACTLATVLLAGVFYLMVIGNGSGPSPGPGAPAPPTASLASYQQSETALSWDIVMVSRVVPLNDVEMLVNVSGVLHSMNVGEHYQPSHVSYWVEEGNGTTLTLEYLDMDGDRQLSSGDSLEVVGTPSLELGTYDVLLLYQGSTVAAAMVVPALATPVITVF